MTDEALLTAEEIDYWAEITIAGLGDIPYTTLYNDRKIMTKRIAAQAKLALERTGETDAMIGRLFDRFKIARNSDNYVAALGILYTRARPELAAPSNSNSAAAQAAPAPETVKVAAPPTAEVAGDWTEDFAHENGYYYNTCAVCEKVFQGHKRRGVCKKCATPAPTESGELPEVPERPSDECQHLEWVRRLEVYADELETAAIALRQRIGELEEERDSLKEAHELGWSSIQCPICSAVIAGKHTDVRQENAALQAELDAAKHDIERMVKCDTDRLAELDAVRQTVFEETREQIASSVAISSIKDPAELAKRIRALTSEKEGK